MPDDVKPVVLLVYANTGVFLSFLKDEADAIEESLKATGVCEVRTVPAATLQDIMTALNDPAIRERIVIAHFAGHANGQGIHLHAPDEGQGELAHMRALARILTTQPRLQLLFINGCTSREQVLELTQAGIPLVVATNRGIDDRIACDFARHFYATLSQSLSIQKAFQDAGNAIQTVKGIRTRALYYDDYQQSDAANNNECPWELHGPTDDRQWTLAEPFCRGTGPRWDHRKYELDPTCPYMGLKPFSEAESDRFFGRDKFVEELLAAGTDAPLLLVIGASGTGKSSVVRAGLIPAWKRKTDQGSSPRAFPFTPQVNPFEEFAAALRMVDSFDRNKLSALLKKPSPTVLHDAVTTFGQGEPWLIFIDQFEQLFTRTSDKTMRSQFIAAIVDLANRRDSNVSLVLAMRDDYFPQLRSYPDLFRLTDKHIHRIAALDEGALREVIERPAAEHGVMVEPLLVKDIIDQIEGQAGALPALQYTLERLWKCDDVCDRVLNRSTYDGIGGVAGSLGKRFQKLYDEQDETGKNEFRWMMLKLVAYDDGPTGSKVVSRLAPKAEFSGRQAELLDKLIDKEQLVVSSGSSAVQLGHERIIDAWTEFADWTKEDREANSVRQELGNAAREWRARCEDARKAGPAMWQAARFRKSLELGDRDDFEPLGGLGPGEDRVLDASESHSGRMMRWLKGMSKAASERQTLRRKVAQALWQGARLQKTLELRARGDFGQLGGLGPDEDRFLDASYGHSQRMIRSLWAAVVLVSVLALGVALLSSRLATTIGERDAKIDVINENSKNLELMKGELERSLGSTIAIANEKAGSEKEGEAMHWFLNLLKAPGGKSYSLRRIGEIAPQLGILLRCRDNISACVFSPDGRWVATGDGRVGFGAERGSVMVWDVMTGDLHTGPLDVPGCVRCLAFSPDSQWLAAGTTDSNHDTRIEGDRVNNLAHRSGEVYVFAVANGRGINTPASFDGGVNKLAFAEGGQTLIAVGGRDRDKSEPESKATGEVRVWDTSRWSDPVSLAGHTESVECVAISSDGKLAVTGGRDKVACVWDLANRKLVGRLEHSATVDDVAISADKAVFWTKSTSESGHELRRWDAVGKPLGEVTQKLLHLEFAPGGVVAQQEDGKTVISWDLTGASDKQQPIEIRFPDYFIGGSPVLTPDGRYAAVVVNRSVRLYDVKTGNKRAPEIKLPDSTYGSKIALSSQGKAVIQWRRSVGTDATLFHPPPPSEAAEFDAADESKDPDRVRFSRDGRWLLAGWIKGEKEVCSLWDMSNLRQHPDPVWQQKRTPILAIHYPFLFVELGSQTPQTARAWNLEAGGWYGNPMTFEATPEDICISVSGARILANTKRDAQLLAARSGNPVVTRIPFDHDISERPRFSPDGKLLAIISGGKLHLFNSADGTEYAKPINAEKSITSILFSADSREVFLAYQSDPHRFVEAWEVHPKVKFRAKQRLFGSAWRIDRMLAGGRLLLMSENFPTSRHAVVQVANLDIWQGLEDVSTMALSPDDKAMFAVVEKNRKKHVYEGVLLDLERLEVRKRLSLNRDSSAAGMYWIRSQFWPDGSSVLTYDSDGIVRRWITETGELVPMGGVLSRDQDKEASHRTYSDEIEDIALGRDTKLIIARSSEGGSTEAQDVNCWDADTGLVRSIPLPGSKLANFVFDPSGRTLVAVAPDSHQIWVQKLPGPPDDDEERIGLSIEVRTGSRLDDKGALRRLTFEDWLKERHRLTDVGGFCDVGSWNTATK
jgi:WD40 repeat protein